MAKKILLADDSLTIQKVVELTFSDSDYSLVCVSNGQRALDRVREDRPDLILADVVMPEKNGYEVCEAIKGDPATARIPVVLLSGTFEPFDRARAERIGADAIVPKPFDSHQLLAQVEALIAKTPPASEPEREPAALPQTTAAIAIPPPAPAKAVPSAPVGHTGLADEAPFDEGFSAEDFTAAVRLPAPRSGIDPFEEEYGRGDVESAIEAFEKAHPKFGLGSRLDSSTPLADAPLDRSEPSRLDAAPEPTMRLDTSEPTMRLDTSEPTVRLDTSEPTVRLDTSEPTMRLDTSEPTMRLETSEPTVRLDTSEPTMRLDTSEPTMRLDTSTKDAASRQDERVRDPQWLRDEPEREKGPFAPIPEEPGSPTNRPLEFDSPSTELDAATVALRRSDFPVRADEMPTLEFPSYERRPSARTEDAGLDSPRGWMDTAPAQRPASTMEISAQDAHALFEVGSHGSASAGESDAAPKPDESQERTERLALGGLAVVPPPLEAPVSDEARETTPESVSGEIEMLAQRSSIPELTQMLSNVRNTGDGAGEMSDEQLDRLAAKVVEKLSDRIVREIAWEVIPDMAEIVIKQRIKELESGAE